MPSRKASGLSLKAKDAPIIMGMVARDDRDHDIAAWFGVNQGRIAEVKDGSKFGVVGAAPANELPPKGPPGIKGRRLRSSVAAALDSLDNGRADEALRRLREASVRYDADEA
jgi:hypothetical protein